MPEADPQGARRQGRDARLHSSLLRTRLPAYVGTHATRVIVRFCLNVAYVLSAKRESNASRMASAFSTCAGTTRRSLRTHGSPRNAAMALHNASRMFGACEKCAAVCASAL